MSPAAAALAPGYNPEQDPPRYSPDELRAALDALGYRSAFRPAPTPCELKRARAQVMPLGRYQGKRLEEIPVRDLRWALSELGYRSELSFKMREAIRLVLSEGGDRP
jgi:uncharacterized protein (DUF3820 family)